MISAPSTRLKTSVLTRLKGWFAGDGCFCSLQIAKVIKCSTHAESSFHIAWVMVQHLFTVFYYSLVVWVFLCQQTCWKTQKHKVNHKHKDKYHTHTPTHTPPHTHTHTHQFILNYKKKKLSDFLFDCLSILFRNINTNSE